MRNIPNHTLCLKCRYHVDINTSIKVVDSPYCSVGWGIVTEARSVHHVAAVGVWGCSGGVVGALADTESMNEDKPPVTLTVHGPTTRAHRTVANSVMTGTPGLRLYVAGRWIEYR